MYKREMGKIKPAPTNCKSTFPLRKKEKRKTRPLHRPGLEEEVASREVDAMQAPTPVVKTVRAIMRCTV